MSFYKLCIGSAGIYTSYLTMSILSQFLYSKQYQSTQDSTKIVKFDYPSFLVWFSSLICAVFGLWKGKFDNEIPNPIPQLQKIYLGFFFTGTYLLSSYSLIYITYLDHALGRNCKYLVAVVVGSFFSRVKTNCDLKLHIKKIYVAILITVGVIMFTFFGKNSDKSKKNQGFFNSLQQWKGYALLVLSLIFDALFLDSQAFEKSNYKPTANHLMTSANFYSFVFVFGFSVLKGEIFQQIYFCIQHPQVLITIILMTALQILGQISIYYVISNFKQHIFPLIATTRKVFTVLLSIFIFGHHVNLIQWISIIIVFIGAFLQVAAQLNLIFLFKLKHKTHQPHNNNKPILNQQNSSPINPTNNEIIKNNNISLSQKNQQKILQNSNHKSSINNQNHSNSFQSNHVYKKYQ